MSAPIVRPDDPAWLRSNIKVLLSNCGDASSCAGCGALIWWMVSKRGKKMPFTELGLNHFADCPKANDFRQRKQGQYEEQET